MLKWSFLSEYFILEYYLQADKKHIYKIFKTVYVYWLMLPDDVISVTKVSPMKYAWVCFAFLSGYVISSCRFNP